MDKLELTRLAPSPTGALHLGNARTFLVNWLLARQRNWKNLLRIEDLDGPRVKKDADRQLIDDLTWLGLDWDIGPVYQSSRQNEYAVAVSKLLQAGLAYPCVCSRKEVEQAASAPHAEDGSTVYPGTCRGRFSSVEEAKKISGRDPAIRFRVPEEMLHWTDQFQGVQRVDLSKLGDFVIAKADGTAAYQLAVVVDDLSAGVTQVVRGDDLLDSTPRQILLYKALGAADFAPNYFHLPLVTGTDGRRLAKRHGDTRILSYRSSGMSQSQMLSLLAGWCGVEIDRPTSPGALLAGFDLARLSREPIVFKP